MRIAALAGGPRAASTSWWVAAWCVLVVFEAVALSVVFDLEADVPAHLNPLVYAVKGARWSAVTGVLLVMIFWPGRQALAAEWRALDVRHEPRRALAIHLVLFAFLVASVASANALTAGVAAPPWGLILAGISVLLAATAVSLLAVLVPLSGLARIVARRWKPVLAASAIGLATVVLSDAATLLWDSMAWATLHQTAALLAFYERDVVVDYSDRSITVGRFTALIMHSCSGYEGLVLVAGFVSVYLWAFRAELRFPQALLLFPVGLAASWLLNSVRIAALISLGAHVSPEVAVKGFHSQAGWMSFLLVAIGLMALAHRSGLMSNRAVAEVSRGPRPSNDRFEATFTHLFPFVGLMLGSIAVAASDPHQQPAYVVKALLVVGALWLIRDRWRDWWPTRLSAVGVGSGLAVGVAWIATSPAADPASGLGAWLTAIGPTLAGLWLLVRGIGTIVLVPIAEELAFRGFLYRRLIARDFQAVRPQALSWLALIVSSLLFGALHGRWLAAALAGMVFALVVIRTGRLGDAIVSHATANALIFGWALAMREWHLL